MNIKEYYNISDPAYSEREIYTHFKHTISWRLLVLSVRLYELYSIMPTLFKYIMGGIYTIIFWRKYSISQEYIDMVNRWEK